MARKTGIRHHAAHPVSEVKPNLGVNQKPNYAPPETAAAPNPNPPLHLSSRAPKAITREEGDPADVSNPDSPNYDPSDPNYDESLDDSQ